MDDIRNTFARFRKALNEAEENNTIQQENGIPYSQQDELFQSSVQTAKTQFGADFSDLKNPMYYFKDDGNVSLTGKIPSLNDATFQFKFKDAGGNGCYIWTHGYLTLSDETLKQLSKINGVYKNWKNELSTAEDIKPMGLKDE